MSARGQKVYLINQNYSHGHQVSKHAKEMMARKRPDVQFVVTTCTRWHRCATLPPTSPRSRLRAQTGDHRQLGL